MRENGSLLAVRGWGKWVHFIHLSSVLLPLLLKVMQFRQWDYECSWD